MSKNILASILTLALKSISIQIVLLRSDFDASDVLDARLNNFDADEFSRDIHEFIRQRRNVGIHCKFAPGKFIYPSLEVTSSRLFWANAQELR